MARGKRPKTSPSQPVLNSSPSLAVETLPLASPHGESDELLGTSAMPRAGSADLNVPATLSSQASSGTAVQTGTTARTTTALRASPAVRTGTTESEPHAPGLAPAPTLDLPPPSLEEFPSSIPPSAALFSTDMGHLDQGGMVPTLPPLNPVGLLAESLLLPPADLEHKRYPTTGGDVYDHAITTRPPAPSTSPPSVPTQTTSTSP